MPEEQSDQVRESQLRRTTAARRGVVAVGAVGALGTAMAVGVGQLTASLDSHSASSAHRTSVARDGTRASRQATRERNDDENGSDEGQKQTKHRTRQAPQNSGTLVVPGNGGQTQGQSSGS